MTGPSVTMRKRKKERERKCVCVYATGKKREKAFNGSKMNYKHPHAEAYKSYYFYCL